MRRRGWCGRWAWLALLPVLAGCAALSHASAPTPGVSVEAPPPTSPAGQNNTVASLPPAPLPPGRPAPPPERPLDPQALKGLDQEQTLGLFGRPTQISEAAPATVWRYRDKGCQLDLFFYMDMGTHSFHVLTYEFRPGERSIAVQRACLNRLREASRAH